MRVTGKIVRFDESRGYGFITPDIGEEDVFLHVNDLEMEKRLATRGTRVSFEIEEGDRGKFATEVHLVADAAPKRMPAADGDHTDSTADDYFDVLSSEEFLQLATERLLQITPPLNSPQILAIRSSFEQLARTQGLIDS